MISTQPGARLTGERPQQGVTPDSLLALHDAGYRAVADRLGTGRVLDIGCGEGFETLRLAGATRTVLGVDYDADATAKAVALGLGVARMDGTALGIADGSFDAVCSSHLVEHFSEPGRHVSEVARVLGRDGTAYFLTPNAPADFENPFHVSPLDLAGFSELLRRSFDDVSVRGVDAPERVKADFAARRAKAGRLLRLDVFDLRHHIPRRWYVALYTRLLPLAYRLIARGDRGGATGITADDWFVTEEVDATTLVLFAVCRAPRRAGAGAAVRR